MDMEQVSALGSDQAPDTSRIETSRLKSLEGIAERHHMSSEDLRGLKVTYTGSGEYARENRIEGKVNGVEVVATHDQVTLNGLKTEKRDGQKIWENLQLAVIHRDKENLSAENQTVRTLTSDKALANLEYENTVGSLRDIVLGKKSE